jgi:alkylation response protein AidB-like acyl-CoA dehydrogenase
MELQLTDDEELFLETTDRFLEDKSPVSELRDRRHDPVGYDPSFWEQGVQLGWTSLLVSEADGGGSISGNGVKDLALVAHAFGSHAAPGPLLSANVVASALSRSGSDEQKATVLNGLLTGELIASWAHAEPHPNDALGSVTASLSSAGDGFTLSGVKSPVEQGAEASHFLVTALADGAPTQVLVAADAEGVNVERMNTVDLTRRFAQVTFDNTPVAAGDIVGSKGGAADDIEYQTQIAGVIQVNEMVGAIHKALDITIEWAFDRYSFGRPLASYQELKHRFADMKMWLEASHALANDAATAVQEGRDDAATAVSAAKAYISEYGAELCQDCVQMHGGIGVTYEHDMHLFLRRVTLNAGLHGTLTDHRLRITDLLEAAGGDAA